MEGNMERLRKFQVGDKVLLFKKSKWIGWVYKMDFYINKELTISKISRFKQSVKFEENYSIFWFPISCLKLIKNKKTPKWLGIWKD
jgi:hypothetical protein